MPGCRAKCSGAGSYFKEYECGSISIIFTGKPYRYVEGKDCLENQRNYWKAQAERTPEMKRLFAFFKRLFSKAQNMPADAEAWYRRIGGTKIILKYLDKAAGYNLLTDDEKRTMVRKMIHGYVYGRFNLDIPDSILNFLIEYAILQRKKLRMPG